MKGYVLLALTFTVTQAVTHGLNSTPLSYSRRTGQVPPAAQSGPVSQIGQSGQVGQQFPQYSSPQRVAYTVRPETAGNLYGDQRNGRYLSREGREEVREPQQYSTQPESRQQYNPTEVREPQQYSVRPENRQQYTTEEVREPQQYSVRPESRQQYSREEAREPQQQYSVRPESRQQYNPTEVRDQQQYSVRPESRQQYSPTEVRDPQQYSARTASPQQYSSGTYNQQYRPQNNFGRDTLGYGTGRGQISFSSPLANTRSYNPQLSASTY